ESRRLTGRGLLLDRAGAVLDVALGESEEGVIEIWRENARRLLDDLGWGGEVLAVRRFPGGASLALSAPIDALYAATEVNEAAWALATGLAGAPSLSRKDVARLAGRIRAEANPRLLALRAAAIAHGVAFLWDDEEATVGLGSGSLTFPVSSLPAPAALDWIRVHDVPVALVTGTNGKTTTVRLTAAMAAAAGRTVGSTSTDRVQVGNEVLDEGDYSGPGGARTLLRDRRVELAILETARGGLLRRGLAIPRAKAALVTNIAADHLGEYGVYDLPSLAEAKLVVAQAVPAAGRVILNADDPELVRAPKPWPAPVTWFTLAPLEERPEIRAHLDAGGDAALLVGDSLVLARGGEREVVARIAEVAIAHGGAARYNVANALAAIGLAAALGLPIAAMTAGLARFGDTPEDNLGRANLFTVGGFRVLLDYAHNPHGLSALLDLARDLPATRRLLLLGQAGDRDDEAIRELAKTAWSLRPDRILLKELPAMLRGRAPGEVPALLEAELLRLGAPVESLERAGPEVEAVERALAWAQAGDLLVLLVHTDRDAVLARLGEV
ncbi:MAG TPA: Mur ligase family protein, partial [Thermoanaerobaculia bacterium]|nr:Mur ligase family protein [Thermoanaerobaculia bacterium]